MKEILQTRDASSIEHLPSVHRSPGFEPSIATKQNKSAVSQYRKRSWEHREEQNMTLECTESQVLSPALY